MEAIWELRFLPRTPAAADLLPGILFERRRKYRDLKRLPAADIPPAVAESIPHLRYAPKVRLEGDSYTVLVGHRALSCSCQRPYSGWARFSAEIRQLASVLRESGLVQRPERFSLKYLDLIDLGDPPDLGWLELDLRLGGLEVRTRPVQLRAEIKDQDFPHGELTHILQIISPAEVSLAGEQGKLRGILVDTDTIKPLADDESWDHAEQWLDDVHSACKRMFFGILKADTVNRLAPEYE